jgi:endonuclease III
MSAGARHRRASRPGSARSARPRKAIKRRAPAPRPARRQLSPRGALQKALPHMERIFGEIVLLPTESVLDKAAVLILREGAGGGAAERALRLLRTEFVDWNEVRISRPSELARLLAGSGKSAPQRRWHDRAKRLRDMIDQVYNDKNDPSFEFLLELKPKDQYEFLAELDDLGAHNAAALVQWLSGAEVFAHVPPSMAKAAQRLGLVESAATTRVRKELADLVGKERLVAMAGHLTQLGEMADEQWPPALAELAG